MAEASLNNRLLTISKRERIELYIESAIAFGIMLFIYLGILLLARDFTSIPWPWTPGNVSLAEMYDLPENFTQTAGLIFSFIFWLAAISFNYSRLKRRIYEELLNHILSDLLYLAQGNYSYRLPQSDHENLNAVIKSINQLVESINYALEEQKHSEIMKDELITNVSHDLRTPLTSIIGYLGLIENGRYQNEDELLAYTHTAYTKAIHMQGLVNDLFDYTSSSSPSFAAEVQTVQLSLIFDQLAADFEIQASDLGIDILTEVDPAILRAKFDVEKFVRVFYNLISNAIKYGRGATYIQLKAWEVSPDQDQTYDQPLRMQLQHEDTLVIEVSNNGELLEEEELDLIFERSYRADKSRTSNEAGTGLGLAIVKNIVELHQGIVYAYINDEALVFRIELPQGRKVETIESRHA